MKYLVRQSTNLHILSILSGNALETDDLQNNQALYCKRISNVCLRAASLMIADNVWPHYYSKWL